MNLETTIKVLSLAGAVATFAWGVFEFSERTKTEAETRRIEATRPFLDRQLRLYTEITRAVATLATTELADERESALKRFWSLYWGELALVEDKRVEAAMVVLGDAIKAGADAATLKPLSLKLAHACRDSLSVSWGVHEWRNPRAPDVPADAK